MWEVRHYSRFYKELAKIPYPTRREIEEIAFGEEIREIPSNWGGLKSLPVTKDIIKSALVIIELA